MKINEEGFGRQSTAGSSFTEQALPPVSNLPDMYNGGIALALENRTLGDTPEAFRKRLYGESYDDRELCDTIWEYFKALAIERGEIFRDGISYLQPALKITQEKKIEVCWDEQQALMSRPVGELGLSVLFYNDHVILGAEPSLEAVAVGELGPDGRYDVQIKVTPLFSSEWDADTNVHVLANPLRFIPTPTDIDQLVRLMPDIFDTHHIDQSKISA